MTGGLGPEWEEWLQRNRELGEERLARERLAASLDDSATGVLVSDLLAGDCPWLED